MGAFAAAGLAGLATGAAGADVEGEGAVFFAGVGLALAMFKQCDQ
jgi:hypothetical protein